MYHASECGCGYHGHHGHHNTVRGGYHHGGCCCGPRYGMRRFPTKEEILTELEEYLEQAKSEVKGVEDRIAELKKAG